MSQYQILQDFKDNLIIFLDELIVQFEDEPDLIIARIFLKDQIPVEDVISNFIIKLLPMKDKVKERDEDFFLSQDIFFGFGHAEETKVNRFKRLWQSNILDKDDRETMWKWFDTFFRLAEKYQKVKMSES